MLFFSYRVLFCLLAFWPALSWSYFGKTNEGLAAFTWTAGLQSPRSVALEGAAAAQPSDDPGVVFMNPAALRSAHDYQVSAAWQSGDLAERQGLLTFSHPLKCLRIQHTYGFVDNGEVEGYDENGEATGISSYPLAQMYAATLTMPLSHFQFGFTGRVLWERLSQSADAQTALASSMDWGLQWTPASPRYGLAFTARNFGTQWRPYVKNGSTDYVTSSNLAASAFFRPARLPRLTVSGEADAPRYAPVALKLGGEYALGNALALRAGVQRNAIDMVRLVRSTFSSNSVPDETGTHRLFSVGAGYQGSWLGVDYSYSHLFESMGGEHRLGLRSGF
jgi:hypothetical protein